MRAGSEIEVPVPTVRLADRRRVVPVALEVARPVTQSGPDWLRSAATRPFRVVEAGGPRGRSCRRAAVTDLAERPRVQRGVRVGHELVHVRRARNAARAGAERRRRRLRRRTRAGWDEDSRRGRRLAVIHAEKLHGPHKRTAMKTTSSGFGAMSLAHGTVEPARRMPQCGRRGRRRPLRNRCPTSAATDERCEEPTPSRHDIVRGSSKSAPAARTYPPQEDLRPQVGAAAVCLRPSRAYQPRCTSERRPTPRS